MRFENPEMPREMCTAKLGDQAADLGLYVLWVSNDSFSAHVYNRILASKEFWGLSYSRETGYLNAIVDETIVAVSSVAEGRAWLMGMLLARGLTRELDNEV